ncbi:hypothetical protein [Clostridium cuniculi]|uniref:hypothetical protein n=1 Tax=Clostridium cuniculi TaxID=2548455 RepID=UPI0010568C25|nr:hypothetical protein [Clostridium cuniculi]
MKQENNSNHENLEKNDKKERFKITLEIVSLVVSISAFILSAFVFFNSTLKKTTIRIATGNKISFSITDETFRVIVPLNFYNSGAYPGQITTLALMMINKDDPSESYLLNFDKVMSTIDATNSILNATEINDDIFIEPKTTINKKICFSLKESIYDSNKNIIPPAGTYKMSLLAWTSTNEKFDIRKNFDVNLSSETVEHIKNNPNNARIETLLQSNYLVPGKINQNFVDIYYEP